jgi:lipopolysaccharide biosynthesis regulator YciM
MPAKKTTTKTIKKTTAKKPAKTAAKKVATIEKNTKRAAVKKTTKATPKKKAPAKTQKDLSYECKVCGFRLIVDEFCGCVEEHVILCCNKPMRKRRSRR